MQCTIYTSDNSDISVYEQFNECARYAKRYGYSIKHKVLDFNGSKLHEAIDKVVFDNEVDCLIVYNKSCIGDYETALFYRIYLNKLGKKLVSCT